MFQNYPDIVTVDDVMTMLRIGRSSVYRLLKNKQIGCVMIGRKHIIPKTSVIGFLENMCYNDRQIIDDGLPKLVKEGVIEI